ncbi:hypothetical protein OG709_25170 [Streptomyces sp. NBC_01267]|uniref:hypothetical protein n=1 Tax=unclassified Streptomyces TaxID=2593676 RepID=UPI002DDA415E|nr:MULTISPECIES: hypothetical protein [unclassified Streptomyces]WSC19836.1 hypothetical protein OIE60_09140 [Streptomyces sp. NBC_01766]
MKSKTTIRAAAIAGVASSAMLIMAPSAYANFSGNIEAGRAGQESYTWSDELYSQVTFHGCTGPGGGKNSTNIQMWQVVTLQPDDSYDDKKFTACFNPGGVSNGEWTDLPSGKRTTYFKIHKIGGSIDPFTFQLWVDKYVVDTTKIDG